MFDSRLADPLRTALAEAEFTATAVHGLLGADAHAALLRNETTAALRQTTDGSALATLTRLFSLQQTVESSAADAALPGLLDPLCGAAILERDGATVRALADLRPYGDEEHDWWVVCDLTPGLDGREAPMEPDHVLGISEASMSLAQLTVREQVQSALDLGSGCGVQSLHLAGHASQVVATDVNRRALAMARATALLNGVDLDVREGSLFEPVTGEQFDLIVSNPPFVISPGTAERLVYRDSGMPGDDVVRRILTDGPSLLRPGGRLQLLANWAHHAGTSWQDRVAEWLDSTGCDAWVLQREVADLPTYVELWLADAGLRGTPEYSQRYDAWLSWFDAQGIEAVGFGWACLRRAERDRPVVRMEEWPHELEQPFAPHIAAWERAAGSSVLPDDELFRRHLVQTEGLVQEDQAPPGRAEPERIVVRQQHGARRARQVDTVEAGMIGVSDGELTVGQILDALAQLLDRDPATLRAEYAEPVRELLRTGYLEPHVQ